MLDCWTTMPFMRCSLFRFPCFLMAEGWLFFWCPTCGWASSPHLHLIYILIRDSYPFSTFPAHLHLQIHMPTSSLSSYLAASAKSAVKLFRQIVTLRGITLSISYNVYGLFEEHLGRPKIAHGNHNDVRHLCWHAGAIFVLLAELWL